MRSKPERPLNIGISSLGRSVPPQPTFPRYFKALDAQCRPFRYVDTHCSTFPRIIQTVQWVTVVFYNPVPHRSISYMAQNCHKKRKRSDLGVLLRARMNG